MGDGNDTSELIGAFRRVKDSLHPVVVHICTLKGKGYAPAEQHKEEWHYCAPFDIELYSLLISTYRYLQKSIEITGFLNFCLSLLVAT